jgi:hypothetical protein
MERRSLSFIQRGGELVHAEGLRRAAMLGRWKRTPSADRIAKRREKERSGIAQQRRAAGVSNRRAGGGAGLLTEPGLVVRGRWPRDLTGVGQDGNQVGIARNLGVSGAELQDMAGNCLLVIGREANLGLAYVVRACDGTDIARIGNPSWRGFHTLRQITVGTEALGVLKLGLRHFMKDRVGLEDTTGREVAKMFRQTEGSYVVDIAPGAPEPLRAVAVAASIVWDLATWGSGGG